MNIIENSISDIGCLKKADEQLIQVLINALAIKHYFLKFLQGQLQLLYHEKYSKAISNESFDFMHGVKYDENK